MLHESNVDCGHAAVERPSGRSEPARANGRRLRKRIAKKIETDELSAEAPRQGPPAGTRRRHSSRRPTDFAGRPDVKGRQVADGAPPKPKKIIDLGDSVASRARKLKKKLRP